MPAQKFRFCNRLSETIAPDLFGRTHRRRSRRQYCLQGSLRRSSNGWESKMKPCTAAFGIFSRDGAAVRFDDRTDDREPHAQSPALCGEKLLEYPFANFLGNAGSIIAHARANRIVTVALGNDYDLALVNRCVVHGVKAIDNQV